MPITFDNGQTWLVPFAIQLNSPNGQHSLMHKGAEPFNNKLNKKKLFFNF
jgi:hypothetical protein